MPVLIIQMQESLELQEQGKNGSDAVWWDVQTLARAYADTCAGVPPWVALNEFFHEWFDYSKE